MMVAADTTADERQGESAHPGWRGILSNRWVLRSIGLFITLCAWQLAFSGDWVNPIFSAPPTDIARVLPEIVTSPEYLPALLSTLRLFFVGYAIAVVLGIFLGLLLARVRVLDAALTPYLNALYVSPLPAIIPIVTAILGYGLATKILIVVLLAVFPVLINTQQGAKSVDGTLLEVARSLKAGEARLWRDVVVPSSLPYVVVGLRLGAARAMIGTAVAELYTSPDGLGFLIHRYGFRFDMDAMLVVVLTFTAISLALSACIGQLERRVDRWRPSE